MGMSSSFGTELRVGTDMAQAFESRDLERDVERLLSEAYRCLVSKDWSLISAVMTASGMSEEDIRQECYLRGWLVMPYACGGWSSRVNYVYVAMVNRVRDLSRYWVRRSAAGLDSVQVGSVEHLSESGDWWVRAGDEGLSDYLMRVELDGLRRRVRYLESLLSKDEGLMSCYLEWLSTDYLVN